MYHACGLSGRQSIAQIDDRIPVNLIPEANETLSVKKLKRKQKWFHIHLDILQEMQAKATGMALALS